MKEIVLSLVFAVPLLIIMIYPAMKISDWLSTRYEINEALDNKLTVILTIVLALIFGVLIRIA